MPPTPWPGNRLKEGIRLKSLQGKNSGHAPTARMRGTTQAPDSWRSNSQVAIAILTVEAHISWMSRSPVTIRSTSVPINVMAARSFSVGGDLRRVVLR